MTFPPPTPAQARIIWLACTGLALTVIVAVLVAFVWGMGKVLNVLAPVLWPLAIAGVLAYLLDPVVDWLERRRIPRTRAILLVFFLAAGLLCAVLGSIVPRVVVETGQLVGRIPEYIQRAQHWTEEVLRNPPAGVLRFVPEKYLPMKARPADVDPGEPPDNGEAGTEASKPSGKAAVMEADVNWDLVERAFSLAGTGLSGAGQWLWERAGKLAGWLGLLIGLALVPVYLFYFLLEKKAIAGQWAQYLPLQDSSFKVELVFIIRSINDYLIAFFRGQVLVAICDAILYTIGFLIIGLNYAFLIGFCAVFLTIIPYLGAFIICAGTMLLAFVQFGSLTAALLPLAVFIVVQGLEGFVIQPKILGDKVGLHPLVIIIAVIVGTTLLGGILGGILAIPIAAALRVILHRYVWLKKDKP